MLILKAFSGSVFTVSKPETMLIDQVNQIQLIKIKFDERCNETFELNRISE